MNAREYARAQARPIGPLRKLIRAVLHALGVPVTPLQVREVAIRLYRPTLTARDVNYRAALTYLNDLELPPEIVVPRPRDFPLEAVASTIEKVVTELRIEGEPITEANRADTRVIEMARTPIEGRVARQAAEPARETIAAIGEDERYERYGWARVLVGAESCSFCAMLASRGAVYTSKQAALGRGGSPLDVFHAPYINDNGKTVGGFCDCTAVIVRKGKPWEGADQADALGALWDDINETNSGKKARNEFRKEWEKQVRAGETQRYLPASVQKAA